MSTPQVLLIYIVFTCEMPKPEKSGGWLDCFYLSWIWLYRLITYSHASFKTSTSRHSFVYSYIHVLVAICLNVTLVALGMSPLVDICIIFSGLCNCNQCLFVPWQGSEAECQWSKFDWQMCWQALNSQRMSISVLNALVKCQNQDLRKWILVNFVYFLGQSLIFF